MTTPRCNYCGADLIPTGSGRCCPNGHGRIQPGGANDGRVKPADAREAGKLIAEYLKSQQPEGRR